MRFVTTVPITRALAAALVLILVCATGSTLHAQGRTGAGLVTSVDAASNTLVLETRNGSQRVQVAAGASIHGDHGAELSFRDLRPGDAVSYRMGSDTAARLHVARQFWALPVEP